MIRQKLAERLKYYRERSNLTIYDVGINIGKSGKTVSAWENGRGQPDADMLLKLCELYKIDNICELYGEAPPSTVFEFDDELREEMISIFNSLNDNGKQVVYDYIKFISLNETYKKTTLQP